jgi:hypothetical protein
MVGAAYYVSRLTSQDPAGTGGTPAPSGSVSAEAKRKAIEAVVGELGADSLSQTIHQLVYGDVVTALLPLKVRRDRGRALEEAWSHTLSGALATTVADMRKGEEQGWRPSLIFSPMLVEDGRRLLISNLDLGPLIDNGGQAIEPPTWGSRSEVELMKSFQHGSRLRLSTAARMNASFPFISPAGALPGSPRRRVVDAGYYDNCGVNLAAIWIYLNQALLQEVASRIVLIQIRDGPYESQYRNPDWPRTTTAFARGVEWLTSPVEAILTARTSVMYYRNDELLELLQTKLNTDPSDPFLQTEIFECARDVSMSWYLTQVEQRVMVDTLMGPAQRRVEGLRSWWGTSC